MEMSQLHLHNLFRYVRQPSTDSSNDNRDRIKCAESLKIFLWLLSRIAVYLTRDNI